MKKIYKILIALVLVLGTGSFIFLNLKAQNVDAAQYTLIPKATVSTGISVAGTSVTLLGASSSRQYAVFVNDGSVPLYISLDGNAAVAGHGIRLNANGGSYEINSLNQFISQVNAITAGTTVNVTVTANQ